MQVVDESIISCIFIQPIGFMACWQVDWQKNFANV
jgi:hypothetical protein